MTMFKMASGSFVNLDCVVLASLSEDGKLLFLYDSGEKSKAIAVSDARDIADIRRILMASDHDLRQEFGITFQAKRVEL